MRKEFDRDGFEEAPPWFAIWHCVKLSSPEKFDDVPYQVKKMATKDACKAFGLEKKKAKQSGGGFVMKFRKRRGDQSLFIPGSAISPHGIYYTFAIVTGKQIGRAHV